jgi:hypothetical protein
MSNYGGSGGSGGSGGGGDYGKVQAFYGVWLHGQIKGLLDQANQRKGEVPPEQSGDVQAAVAALEQAVQKLGRWGK